MKRYLLYLIITFFAANLSAQLKPTDRIQTKSGKIYQGIIVEQIPGHTIKMLKIPELDTVVVLYPDVAKILRVFDNSIAEEKPKKLESEYTWWSPCFNCRDTYVMLHFFGAAGNEEVLYLGAGLSFGYNVFDLFQIGLSANVMGGTENISDDNLRVFMPLALDIRYVFSESRRGRGAFLLGVSSGVSVPMNTPENLNHITKTGLYFSGTFGFRFNVTSQFGFMLDFGYAPNSLNFYDKNSGEHLEHKWYQMGIVRGSIFF